MMNRLMRYSCLLLCLSAGLTACDDDGIDVLDIEIPDQGCNDRRHGHEIPCMELERH